MKNTIKFLGIIALIAIIGFSMSSCDPEKEDDSSGNNGGGGNEIKFMVSNTNLSWDVSVTPNVATLDVGIRNMTNESATTFNALTAADVTFTPNDIVTRTGFDNSGGMITIPATRLKAGTVTVTIKDKNGFSFVPYEYYGALANTFTVN
jgi:hypothetical protein